VSPELGLARVVVKQPLRQLQDRDLVLRPNVVGLAVPAALHDRDHRRGHVGDVDEAAPDRAIAVDSHRPAVLQDAARCRSERRWVTDEKIVGPCRRPLPIIMVCAHADLCAGTWSCRMKRGTTFSMNCP
jgi:hypothetical protein